MLGEFFSWLSNPEEVAEFLADTTVCLLIFYIIYFNKKGVEINNGQFKRIF